MARKYKWTECFDLLLKHYICNLFIRSWKNFISHKSSDAMIT